MKKLNVRSKQVVAMVLFFIMTMTAIHNCQVLLQLTVWVGI
ncbi:MAG: hypothetical protein ACLTE2_13510 [Eubacteriales bacterium]